MITRSRFARQARRWVLPALLVALGGGLSGCAVYPAYPGYARPAYYAPAYYGPYVYPNVAVRGVFVWHGR